MCLSDAGVRMFAHHPTRPLRLLVFLTSDSKANYVLPREAGAEPCFGSRWISTLSLADFALAVAGLE